ncbi:MAG TPA: mutarotase [Verrucomicrobiota bacterium]|nr:mutarotase [Verrucomicrobiota bacterium]
MSLAEHYDKLYCSSIERIRIDNYQIDDLIDSPNDKRRGITLLIRPDENIRKNVHGFIDKLKAIEPRQYYYPDSDIHLTVLSIILCYEGFDLSHIAVDDYVKVISRSLHNCSSFMIEFKGITASPSCIMIQGLPQTDILNQIRNSLRRNFKASKLQQSIDKRYTIKTAHLTAVRFKKKLKNKEKFLKLVEAYRSFDFGGFKVDTMELVYNDWYLREKYVKQLYRFNLKSNLRNYVGN